MNPPDLSTLRVLVTGAGSGIGKAGALAYASAGAAVAVADLNADTASATADEIVAGGGTAIGIGCDVTDEAQVESMIARTVAELGGLDAAFNNAGNALGQFAIHELPIEEWRASVEVNLTGTFLCCKHELRHFLDNGGGAIVNTASGAARVPAPGRSPYSAAKRGVVALTAHIAQDYGRKGVRANAVLPGLIDTPGVRQNYPEGELENVAAFLPGGQLGTPEHVADVAVWLCSDGARHVSGQAIVVDGGGILA